jgi:hypothetical protein
MRPAQSWEQMILAALAQANRFQLELAAIESRFWVLRCFLCHRLSPFALLEYTSCLFLPSTKLGQAQPERYSTMLTAECDVLSYNTIV